MIKIRKGNTRIAVLLFRLVVIKFPNPRLDRIRSFEYWTRRKSFFGFLGRSIRNFYDALMWGVALNTSEALVYHYSLKAKYLSPVFTLGLLNFMPYEGEDEPTREEIDALYRSLSDKARKFLLEADCHEYASHNWRRTPEGLKLIDYGQDPLKVPWAVFLRANKRELTQATAKK